MSFYIYVFVCECVYIENAFLTEFIFENEMKSKSYVNNNFRMIKKNLLEKKILEK